MVSLSDLDAICTGEMKKPSFSKNTSFCQLFFFGDFTHMQYKHLFMFSKYSSHL